MGSRNSIFAVAFALAVALVSALALPGLALPGLAQPGLAQPGLAQQPAPTEPAGKISGRFVTAGTRRPLRGVMVTLRPNSKELADRFSPTTMVSTDTGSFEFEHLPPGAYLLRFSKPGYGEGASYSIAVADGETVDGVEIEMPPPGVISGTVFDADGNRFAGATVEAESSLSELRAGWLKVRGKSRTDDQGRYRIWDLKPGRYYVRAHEGVQASRFTRFPTYYPNSTDAAGAAAVRLDWETEAGGIDIRLQRASGMVAGILRNGVTGAAVPRHPIRIQRERRMQWPMLTATTAQDGTFVVEGLGPGSYRFNASLEDEQLHAYSEVVVVPDRDTRVDLELLPGVEISGVARVAQLQNPNPPLEKAFAFDLELDDPQEGPGGLARKLRESDGAFVVENVQPGTYRVRSNCGVRDGYVVGLAIAGRDLPSLVLRVLRGVAIQDLEIRCGFDRGEVRGVVKPSAGAAAYRRAPHAFVWCKPAGDSLHAELGNFPVRADGRFEGPHLPVGRYTFYAISRLLEIDWNDIEVVRALAPYAQTVEIKAGETAEVELVYVPSGFRLP